MESKTSLVTETVRDFFARYEVASLKLPDRWFGRPHDNWHQLSSVGANGTEVRVILDGQQVLTFDPVSVEVVGRELRIATTGGHWQWQPYGGSDIRDEGVPSGTIEFHAPFSVR